MRKSVFIAALSATSLSAAPAHAEMVSHGVYGNWEVFNHGSVCSMSRSYGNYYHAVAGPFGSSISFGFGSTELSGVTDREVRPLKVSAGSKSWGTVDANGMVSSNGMMAGYNFLITDALVGSKLPKSVTVKRDNDVIQTLDLNDAGPAYAALLDCSAEAK